MALVIRRLRAEPDEIEALARLRHAAFFQGSTRTLDSERSELAAFARRDTVQEAGLVAELDGLFAGCCLLVPREIDQRHDCGPWLAGLAVVPELRGRGIGSALVRAIEHEARLRDIPRLFLYTSSAEPFYAALGWTRLDAFTDSDGDVSVLMTRNPGGKALAE